MNTISIKSNTKESGVTLVVAVVLLAAVTFISFSISTIVIREIQGGRLTLRTEPAISGANSGGEVGLYRLFREAGGTAHTGSLVQTGVNFEVKTYLYENTYNFSVPAGGSFDLLLYDVENPALTTTGYGSVTVTLNSGSGSVNIKVYSWADVNIPLCAMTLTSGSSSCNALTNPDDRYIVRIQSLGSAVSGYAQAYDDAAVLKGIPSDTPKLDVKGTNGPVQRKIEIIF